MHRILRAEHLQGERRQQRPPQSHAIPRLKACAPNQVWTWDIAKLPTLKRGEYLSLYVVMDLFSRYIVAWMLSLKENSALSSQLIEEASQRYGITENTLTLHQDRGTPMTAHCYLDLLSELAITASHSRPRAVTVKVSVALSDFHAATRTASVTTVRSGFSDTNVPGTQFRVSPLQRSGCAALAARLSACRSASMALSSPVWRCIGVTKRIAL